MPANNQRPAAQTPVSPRNTSKYTNKDGSKFITVPKGTPSESSLPSTPTTAKPSDPPLDVSNVDNGPAPAINRKKQKRRQKAAAKAAAQQAANGHIDNASSHGAGAGSMSGRGPADHEEVESDDEFEYILESELTGPPTNGHLPSDSRSKKNRKKKKKGTNADPTSPIPEALEPEPHPNLSQGAGMSRDKIWSTSNQEERERIKAFWLGLGEDERKSLVKVEKDAVLKKMKEQQKHTCSCTVCGRKRTAIEEELEGLYDAYYLELEQFANQGEGPPMLPSARDFALRRGLPSSYTNRPPSRGRIVEHVGDEEDEEELEEVYSEDEVEDDDYSDDEPPEEFQTSHERDVADFLTFGNSLQVKGTQLLESLLRRYGNMDLGGILTVADDLLKNDGKRFIEMMEQLAERRMAREEDAREHFSRGYGHPGPNGSYSNPHNPPPPPEEDEYDEEEDEEEDYDDSQDEEYEEEEDQMTEEQRMEEGRRMFQIFAARMFEQRVLSAYKEKVAKERQQRLLEEIEAEDRESELKKAKKAKDAQKKKDKAAQKKQALAEEKARKEAEKAAADAARLEAERQRVAEQKARAEEKRKQKEAQKKAEEEARLRKEAERQRRLHEQREKQAEQERKAREAKEKEKKLKEEQRQRDKEAREQKEREAQERKDKQERDKRDKEARAAKAQKDAQAAREAKEKLREEKAAAQKAASHPSQPIQIPKRGSQPPVPTALPQHTSNPASYASPKIPVATPVLSKAPTPIRPRTTSQQQDVPSQSATTSSTSQDPSPHSMTPRMSPGPIGQRHGSASTQHSYSVSPTNGQPRMHGQSPFQMPPMGMQPPPGLAHHHPPPGFGNRMPHEAIFSGFRHSPGAMMPPPGINGPPRGFPVPMPPGFSQPVDQFDMGGFPLPTDLPPPSHHRQSSLQFDAPPTPSQPIGRPAPIGRPGSLSQSRTSDDQEDETAHLGSRALLEDDEPLAAEINPGSLRNQPPGPRGDFTTSPFLPSAFPLAHNPWGPPTVGGHPLPPPGFNNPGWGAPSVPPGFGMTSPISAMSSIRAPAQPRYVTVRAMLCQACKELASSGDSEGYIDIATLKSRIDAMSGDHSISELDLLNLCETEGNPINGGGTFDIRRDAAGPSKHTVRWEPDLNDGLVGRHRSVGAPGEIGSPLMGQATLRGGL